MDRNNKSVAGFWLHRASALVTLENADDQEFKKKTIRLVFAGIAAEILILFVLLPLLKG